ncbi:MAG: hypothetical protein GPJ13_03045 [Microcystis aeruginosa W11-06]|nr:hypothetical protein [Microcystis aeruginosa W11-03]NCR92783.1 hypothetical protein [Microcystis aeruginosa W11-06]
MKKFSPPEMKEVSFPTPYTPHPTPHTLHPTPYTPHPTPHFSNNCKEILQLCRYNSLPS